MLLKVTLWCKLFIANTKIKENQLSAFNLVAEIRHAEHFRFRCEQSRWRQSKRAVLCRLSSLNPFIGNNGIIRIGGRFEHANICFDAKHPYVLPNSSRLATLFIDHAHRDKAALKQPCHILVKEFGSSMGALGASIHPSMCHVF